MFVAFRSRIQVLVNDVSAFLEFWHLGKMSEYVLVELSLFIFVKIRKFEILSKQILKLNF